MLTDSGSEGEGHERRRTDGVPTLPRALLRAGRPRCLHHRPRLPPLAHARPDRHPGESQQGDGNVEIEEKK